MSSFKTKFNLLRVAVLSATSLFVMSTAAESSIQYFNSVKKSPVPVEEKTIKFTAVKPEVKPQLKLQQTPQPKSQPKSQSSVQITQFKSFPTQQKVTIVKNPSSTIRKTVEAEPIIHQVEKPDIKEVEIAQEDSIKPAQIQAQVVANQNSQLQPTPVVKQKPVVEPQPETSPQKQPQITPKPVVRPTPTQRDIQSQISRLTGRNIQEERTWNLKDVELRTLINEVSQITGKNFVVGPNVNAKVTFISQEKLNADELYTAFETLLNAYGFEAIPRGNVIEITSLSKLKKNQSAILLEDATVDHGPIIVTTFRIQNYPVADLVKVLQPLLPRYSYVEAYKPSNDLIIADLAENIPNVRELIQRLDRPASQQLEVIPLHYAIAEELAKSLNELLVTSGKAQASPTTQKLSIVPDPRSNSLLVNGGNLEQRRDLMTLINQLDTKRRKRQEDTEVIYLKYLPAETFAPIVQNLLDNYMAELTGKSLDESRGSRGTTSSTSSSQRPSLVGSFNLQNPLSNQASSAGGISISPQKSETSKSGSYGPRVQWEQSTNSIIVTAPLDLIKRVRYVVKQLDIRRPQVLIEAIIAECVLDKDLELGIEWREFNNQFNTRFSPTGPLTTIDPTVGNYNTGGVLGAVGSGLTLGIFKNMNLRFLLRALKGDTNSNILATPNIVTLDNEPALIKIGRQVSFAIGEIENNPTGGNPFTSFNREDVGLTLSIKPQITPNGSIRLYIEQILSSVLAGTERAGGNPDTSQRYIQTTVMADDGQILVLGGLLQNEWQQIDDKVPVLGDIPYVGALFRNTYKKRNKTNLMLFLRPVIIYDQRDSEMVSSRKYQYLSKPSDTSHHPHKHHAHAHSHTPEWMDLPEPW